MSEKFVTLTCQSCGAKLDVYDDLDRFACRYCGTEMVVQRRGGTVALHMVEAAIKQVQVGTDKTAAELAIARYMNELDGLRAQAASLAERSGETLSQAIGCGGLLALIGGGVLVWSKSPLVGIALLLVGGLWIVGVASTRKNPKLENLRSRARELEARIEEKRRIADA